MGYDDDENAAWVVEDEVLTEIDAIDRIPERSVLDMALPGGSLPSIRREQFLVYIWETFVRNMNFNPVPHLIDIESDSNYKFGCMSEEESFDDTS